jgi:transposase
LLKKYLFVRSMIPKLDHPLLGASVMRGADGQPGSLFSYVALEDRIPADHPLRVIRTLIDPMLVALSSRFDEVYSGQGRPREAPPGVVARSALYHSKRAAAQLDYNLLFRWFVGLGIDDPVWVATVFTKNRDRLLAGNIADALLQEVLRVAHGKGLLSHEHFTVDGTLLEAWASHKSFRPKDDGAQDPTPPPDGGSNPSVNFRGERRSNATHASTTDPDARLARKSNGTAAILAYQASALMDNRHGLVVGTHVTEPGYAAEGDAALELLTTLEPRARRRTMGPTRGTIARRR